jgi:hypothetical protein
MKKYHEEEYTKMLFLLKASYFRKFLDWTFHFREGLFSK